MIRNAVMIGWLLSASAHAQTHVSTELQSKAEKYPGFEYRKALSKAVEYVGEGRPDAAWNVLQPALQYCDGKKNGGKVRYYSVADKGEEAEYRREAPAGVELVFVDRACPSAYKTAAFLALDTKETARALALLDRAQELAPHWAEAVAERAYLVGKQGDSAKSLSLYRKALALAEKYPSSAYAKGLILRGIGYHLVEAGDLEGAARAYQDSLKTDPDNALARRELNYIKEQQAKARPD